MKKFQLITAILLTAGLACGVSAFAAKQNATDTVNNVNAEISAAISIDINSADAKQLASLKGIGAKKAAAIIAYRNKNGKFTKLAQLANVDGFSDATVAKLEKNNPNLVLAKG